MKKYEIAIINQKNTAHSICYIDADYITGGIRCYCRRDKKLWDVTDEVFVEFKREGRPSDITIRQCVQYVCEILNEEVYGINNYDDGGIIDFMYCRVIKTPTTCTIV